MNIVLHLVILGILVVVLIGFLYYRYRLTSSEDDTLHVGTGEESIVSEQAAMVKRMAKVDIITKVFIAVVVIYGLAVAAIYSYLQLPQ